jgi:HSP20 family molecular chaperone IbpA
VEEKREHTAPFRAFLPATDIFETEQALNVVLEMPGVGKDNVDVSIEDDVLRVEGRIDYGRYEGLQPLYTEYNVGHYVRSFELSGKIDQGAIKADMKDGIVTLMLPKIEKAKPRRIALS